MAKSNPEINISGIEFKLIGKNLIGMIPLEKLVPYYRNPRHNSHAVPKVKASIAEFGMQQPLVVIPGGHEAAKSAAQDEFEIVVGHTRHLSCIELDYDPVPCILAKDLSAQQVAEYRIADNALNDLAEWNFEDLKMELESLQEMGSDFSLLGFTDEQLKIYMDDWSSTLTPEAHDKAPSGSIVFKIEIKDEDQADHAAEIIKNILDDNGISYHFAQ